MKHSKIYRILLLTILIVSLSYVGYNYYKNNNRQRSLSHDELIGYINKFCLYNKGKNLKIESEKDIDDLHTVLLSYEDSNYNRSICFVVFDKLANGKYKYRIYRHAPLPTNFGTLITSDTQSKDSKYYGFFYGIVTDKDLNKLSVTIGENTFTEVVENNKFFINVYDMGNSRCMGLTPIYDKQ